MRNNNPCYCQLWETDPSGLEAQGLPRGYCGLCQVCAKPGHTMHFPGAVPVTGAWCKRHYLRAAILHPLGWYGKWFYAGLLALGVLVWWLYR